MIFLHKSKIVQRLVLVRDGKNGRAVERFRQRKARSGYYLVRLRSGIRREVGVFLTGGNREAETENMGNSEEEFDLLWKKKGLA